MSHKIAFITGGSRGLGRSMALNLAQQGRDVVFTYVKNEAEAAKVAALIEGLGRKALALRLDTGDTASFAGFAKDLKAQLKGKFNREKIDFLINNAGQGLHANFTDTTPEGFDDLYRVHFKGPYFLSQALLPLINDGGAIVNISTGLTRFAFPGYSAYASMKGAIETLTKYMAKELGPRGISVNAIAPGAIETDFGGGRVRDDKELNKMVAGLTALGRVGQPDDVGGAVAALLSDGNRWVTGQRIEVSGGQNL